MVKLVFYGGVGEIGGNKILIKSKDASIFLDFGKNFSLESCYFDEPWVQPWYIPDLEKIDAIPRIDGLYRNSGKKSPIDGVILSHPHVDHYDYISLLNKTKIYLGEDTKNMIDLRNETYMSDWDRKYDHLEFETFFDDFEIKDIGVKPIAVNHSIPGAYAFIIYTDKKKIAYTGDFRMHGYENLTKDFLNELKNGVDILLCEGTNLGGDDEFIKRFEMEFRERRFEEPPRKIDLSAENEVDVKNRIAEIAKRAKGLVIVETMPADVDRIRSVYLAAKESGRKLVLSRRQAYLVYNLGKLGVKKLPSYNDSYVYLSRTKVRGEEGRETYYHYRYEWEKKLIDKQYSNIAALKVLEEMAKMKKKDVVISQTKNPNIFWGELIDHTTSDVTGFPREELRKNCKDYLICTENATARFLELKDGEFPCDFILSRSEPFSEEMIISFDKLLHWLNLYKIKEYYSVHVSGHCSPKELKQVIEIANPKLLIPIHTSKPELFRELTNVEIIIPEKNKIYEI